MLRYLKEKECIDMVMTGAPRRPSSEITRAEVQPDYRIRSTAIERRGRPTFFARNMQIYRETEPANYVYKLISGTVRTCRALIDGRGQIAAFYLPGDLLGLERGEEHVFSAEAVTDVRLLVTDRGALISRAKCNNDIARELWTLMKRELQIAQDHVGLLIKTAPERVATFLLEMGDRMQSRDQVELPMSRQDIADYLGLTIETVSRTLTQLENASVIALPCSKRIVLNRPALKRLVEGDCKPASGMDKGWLRSCPKQSASTER